MFAHPQKALPGIVKLIKIRGQNVKLDENVESPKRDSYRALGLGLIQCHHCNGVGVNSGTEGVNARECHFSRYFLFFGCGKSAWGQGGGR